MKLRTAVGVVVGIHTLVSVSLALATVWGQRPADLASLAVMVGYYAVYAAPVSLAIAAVVIGIRSIRG